MDQQQSPWDSMGDLTAGPPPQQAEGGAPFYLAPNNVQKIQSIAKANNVHPDQLVDNVKRSIASGKSTPQQAQQELDSHYEKSAPAPDVSGAMPSGQDWLKPLLALADSETGSKLSQSYTPPTSQADIANYQNKLSGAQSELLGRDPNSQLSQNARQRTTAALKAALPGKDVSQMVPETMSANDIQNDDNIKSLLSGGFGVQGNQLKAQAMAAKNDSFNDRNVVNVSKDYEKSLEAPRKMQEDISRVEAALATKDKNGNSLITKQQLGDINATIARIFSPGHMSDSTVARTEYESMPAQFMGAIQTLIASPQDVGSRALINHILDQAHHIGNVTNSNALKELQSLNSGYASGSPALQKVANSKSDFFNKRFGTPYPTEGGGPAPIPAGRVTVKDAKGNVGHIPAEQLEDAKKQGYTEVK